MPGEPEEVAGSGESGWGAVFAAATLLMMGATLGLSQLVWRRIFWPEVVGAWAVALANAGVAAWLNRSGVGRGHGPFVVRALAGNVLRLAVLLATVLAVCFRGVGRFDVFGVTVVAGVLVYMVFEVWRLYRTGTARPSGGSP